VSDEDDDAPAVSGDMEPELRPGDPEPHGADEDLSPDEAEDVALGRQDDVSPSIVRRRGHPASKQVRELFKKAAADIKRQLGENGDPDDDEDALDYEEPEHPAPGDKVMPAANAAPPADARQPTPGAQASPAPSQDAEIQKLREELSGRTAELDERERAIEERERASDVAAFGQQYAETPVSALRELFKRRGIATTDDEWKNEVADLVTDLSGSVLGVPLPPEIKNRIDAKRALRAAKLGREQMAAERTALDKQRQAAEADAQRARALDALGKELRQDTHAKAYPWLVATDNPADIVWDVIETAARKGEPVPKWTDAAKRANDYLQQQVTQQMKRWGHLLEPQRPNGSQPERRQGDPQVRRSMTPAEATKTVERTPPPGDAAKTPSGRWSNDLHRRNTKRLMREAFRTRDE
jgi:hypothetical protein